ncbi:protein shisa-5 [Culicoides brevitarsis]|uniref:protein shisa-5 n=1 Tax=Culicoides brevitarsis TaxID=469753 RepID=UPI00307B6432
MGFVKYIAYAIAIFIFISLCSICFKRRKRSSGVIFTTVQAVPVQNQTVAVAPGTTYVAHQAPYPTQAPPIVATVVAPSQSMPPMGMPQPYHGVPQGPPQMQMPMPYGQPAVTQFASPPPYDQVVREPYQQQSPYNPNYAGN